MSASRDVLSTLRLESGAAWAEAAEPFQLSDARMALEGERPYTYVTRPRGGSKTTDAGVCSLAWLLSAPAGARGFLAAADRDQAALGLDTIRGFLDRSPELRSQVEVQSHRVIATATGASLEALAADLASSWGLRPEWLVVDELAYWGSTPGPRKFWESISSAVAKSSTARMVVITSPSDPAHFSHAVLEEARASDLWTVSEQHGPPKWLDPSRVEDQRRRLPESTFARLFLGQWVSGEDKLATHEAVLECVAHDGPLDYEREHEPYVVAGDIGLKRDATACVICHREGARVVLDRIETWQGSRLKPVRLESVEGWLEQSSRSYGNARIVLDPYQAVGLAQRLRGRGARVDEHQFTATSVGRLAGGLYSLLRDRNLALIDDEGLIDELSHVQLRESAPGVFRMEKPGGGRSDDRATALALAAVELLREPEYRAPSTTPYHPWGLERPRPRLTSRPPGIPAHAKAWIFAPSGRGRPTGPSNPVKNPNRRRPRNG